MPYPTNTSSQHSAWPLASDALVTRLQTAQVMPLRIRLALSYARSPELVAYLPPGKFLTSVLPAIMRDFTPRPQQPGENRYYPLLREMAERSATARKAFIFAYGIFDGQMRSNSPTPLVWHSMDAAERFAELVGADAVNGACELALHDSIEDTTDRPNPVSRQLISKIVSPEIAEGVECYTHPDIKERDWRERATKKVAGKMSRATRLSAARLIGRMIDNADEVRTNRVHLQNGLLRVDGRRVYRLTPQTYSHEDEFPFKLEGRRQLNVLYAQLLAEMGRRAIEGGEVDCAQIAGILSADFLREHDAQAQILTAGGNGQIIDAGAPMSAEPLRSTPADRPGLPITIPPERTGTNKAGISPRLFFSGPAA